MRDADLLGETRVMLQVAALAVDRDEPARSHEREQQTELLLRRVTRSRARGRPACGYTSAPLRYSESTTRWIAGSFPGIRLEESTTVSPSLSLTHLCSRAAIRLSAQYGSP